MFLAILTVGWLTAVVSTAVAVVAGDPGLLGGLAIFSSTGVAGTLVAGVALAMRPEPDNEHTPEPDAQPALAPMPAAR